MCGTLSPYDAGPGTHTGQRALGPVPGPVPTSPANRNYQPGFAAAMMLKDLRLAETAAAKGASPLGSHAAALYAEFVAQGGGGTDFSGIIERIRGSLKPASERNQDSRG